MIKQKEYPLCRDYIISEDGNVFSVRSQKIMKKQQDRYGYLYVSLCIGGKKIKKKIHRLVCETFLENPQNKPQVNHKNGIKKDNRLCNLEWTTQSENMKHLFRVLSSDGHLQKEMSKRMIGRKIKKESSVRGGNKRRYEKNGRARKILCVETGEIYNSIIEAVEKTKSKGIYEALSRRSKTKKANGLHWNYI